MSSVIPLQPQFYLELGGSPAPTDLLTDLARIEVDLSLYMPDSFTIEIHDERFRWAGDNLLKIGQEVQIGARAAEEERGPSEKLLIGEITAVEANYDESGVPTVIVHGYDRAHRLHRGTRVRAFSQVTDSDVASTIARERGLTAEVDATTHVYSQLIQDNLTDFQFLTERARAVGFVFALEQRKVVFKKPGNVTRPVVELDYRTSLLEFRTRLTVSAQVPEVSVRGWDPVAKRALIGRASSVDFQTAKTGWAKRGSAIAGQMMGTTQASVLVSDAPISSQAEGDAMARSLLSERWSNDLQAEGVAVGHTGIRGGTIVKVDGIAPNFNGEYFVTRARHVFEASGEYRTLFTVGGFGADTTADLLFENAAVIERQSTAVSRGLAIALVTNNEDPEKRGRVKVKYPWLGDDIESFWAPVVAPMAGAGRGFFFLPEVNDEVLIGFEHGDFNFPYVVGALWNGVDKPPIDDAVSAGKVQKRMLKTRAGHILVFDDTSGKESIKVIDKTGKNSITIDSSQNTITVEADGDVQVTSKKKVGLKGMEVSIEGTQKVELKGAEISLSGTGGGKIKISGPTVEIN